MVNIIHKISRPIFDWVLTKTSNTSFNTFEKLYNEGAPNFYDGRDWGLIFMLLVCTAAVLVYYFGVASNLKNATRANYLIVWGLGIVTILLLNCFVIPNIITPKCPIGKIWDLNLLKFCLIDIVYYSLVYEILSFVFMRLSRDKHRHLINTIFGK